MSCEPVASPEGVEVIDDQGGISWTDVLCVPTGAPNPEGANAFIAFMLDPKISAANAATLGADTGNDAARAFIPSAILNDESSFPNAEISKRLSFRRALDEPTTARYEDAWIQVNGS